MEDCSSVFLDRHERRKKQRHQSRRRPLPMPPTLVALLDGNLTAVASIQILTKKQTYHAIFDKIRYNSQLESFCCIAMHNFLCKALRKRPVER
jgi:hypothetical protein